MRYLHDINVDGYIELTTTHNPNIPKMVKIRSTLTELLGTDFLFSPISA